MPDIKLKNWSADDRIYEGVPCVWLDAPDSTEEDPNLLPYTYGVALDDVEVYPDFSGGDMRVTMPEGYLARSAVAIRPESLIPGNIKKGEVVAGIMGEYEGEPPETEEISLEADFSAGDMVIRPSEGKYLNSVTVVKPESLIPENIAKDVEVAGLVGTHEGNGGGSEKRILPFMAYNSVKSSGNFSSTTGTLSVSVTIPANAVIVDFKSGGSLAQDKTSMPSAAAACVPSLANNTFTKANATNGITITYQYTWAGTNRYYKAVTATIAIVYWIPGITIETIGDKHLIVFDETVSICPGMLTKTQQFTDADLSRSKITALSSELFREQKLLESVLLPATLTSIGDYAFYYCSVLNSVNLPAGLKTIGNQAFNYCTKLQVIELPDGLSSVGGYAFANCSTLNSISMPDSLNSIGNYAFQNCKGLTEISIPKDVTSIGTYAFGHCSALKMVDCSACTNIPSLGTNAFYNCNSELQIEVPESLYEDWIASSGWSNYSSIIIPV